MCRCRNHFLLMKLTQVVSLILKCHRRVRSFVWEVENAFSWAGERRSWVLYLRHQLIGAHIQPRSAQVSRISAWESARPESIHRACIHQAVYIHIYWDYGRHSLASHAAQRAGSILSPRAEQRASERHTAVRMHTSLAHYVILAQINRSTQASLAHSIRREHDDSRPNHCYYSRFVLSTFFVSAFLLSASGETKWALFTSQTCILSRRTAAHGCCRAARH